MITDKELLTFCNLANLEMEYANLIKKEKKKDENGNSLDEEIEINHTIYTIFIKKNLEKNIQKMYYIKNWGELRMKKLFYFINLNSIYKVIVI